MHAVLKKGLDGMASVADCIELAYSFCSIICTAFTMRQNLAEYYITSLWQFLKTIDIY